MAAIPSEAVNNTRLVILNAFEGVKMGRNHLEDKHHLFFFDIELHSTFFFYLARHYLVSIAPDVSLPLLMHKY